MRIRFTRTPDGQTVLTCVRADSSRSAVVADAPRVERAMVHYAVETILGFRQALFGLLAAGWELAAFDARPSLPPEAALAEHVVDVVRQVMGGALAPAELDAALANSLAGAGIAPPAISAQKLESIVGQARANLEEWADLHPGATLELPFPLARPTYEVAA